MRFQSAALPLISVLLAGCASPGIDAVRPSKLGDPIFVVVPPNQSVEQDAYATGVERFLLGSGMRVAVRPTFKSVRIESSGSEYQSANSPVMDQGVSGDSALSQDEDRIVDSFLAMNETNAKYRVNTYAWSKMVELVDLSNQQVLSVFPLSVTSSPEFANALSNTLSAIGFRVSERKSSADGRQGSKPKELVGANSQSAPIFTVIPSTDLSGEGSFSIRIERILVRLGLHVVRPPAPHYRVQSSSIANSAAKGVRGEVAGAAASTRRVESFWAVDDTPASVILETTSYGNKIKVIDKATKEVRSVISIPMESEQASMKRIKDALIAIGVPVVFEFPKPNSAASAPNNSLQARRP